MQSLLVIPGKILRRILEVIFHFKDGIFNEPLMSTESCRWKNYFKKYSSSFLRKVILGVSKLSVYVSGKIFEKFINRKYNRPCYLAHFKNLRRKLEYNIVYELL